jgi:hypothetical protein
VSIGSGRQRAMLSHSIIWTRDDRISQSAILV